MDTQHPRHRQGLDLFHNRAFPSRRMLCVCSSSVQNEGTILSVRFVTWWSSLVPPDRKLENKINFLCDLRGAIHINAIEHSQSSIISFTSQLPQAKLLGAIRSQISKIELFPE